MKLVTSPNCTHCQVQMLGTTMHMLWECLLIRDIWIHVKMIPLYLRDMSLHQHRLMLAGFTAEEKNILTLV